MSRRAKLAVGTLLIGAVLASLWAVYRPLLPSQAIVKPDPTPAPPRLEDSRAVLTVRLTGRDRPVRATITCDGARRAADGYWRGEPRQACDALAASRTALLGAPGCRTGSAGVRLHATGRFGARRFDHRAQRGVCPDDEAWLAVNVLAAPVLGPDRALEDPVAEN